MNLNLLPNQAKFQMAKMKIRSKIRQIMYISIAVWLFLIVGVFAWWGGSQIWLDRVNKKHQSWQNQYNALGDYAVTSLQLKYRAKIVGQLLASRFEYGKSMNLVQSLFSSNISLDNFELDSNKQVIIDGIAKGGEGMDEVEKKVDDINNGKIDGFEAAEIKDLSFRNNNWKFALEVNLK